jgi:hypothetical protein
MTMSIRRNCMIIGITLSGWVCTGQDKCGATLPWKTYEAERMHTTGRVMGPQYEPYQVETESSGQQCVKLDATEQYVEFTAVTRANSMVIRYSLPDSRDGNGAHVRLGIYAGGKLARYCTITSHYSWLYGKYPFTNDPAAGSPRHFYDEIRVKDLKIRKGDVIRIQRNDNAGDNANYCIIDLVDLEQVAPPLKAPLNSLSITNKAFLGSGFTDDYTEAFRNCITKASETGKTVWIPAGTFKITGDITLPENITIQGAGMWYTELVGDSTLYAHADNRVRLKGNGGNIHISGFSIIGKLNYRSDKEDNDGIVGHFGTNSTIAQIWIEHTKVGMWIDNSSRLKITGCRMRNTMADGINFCVGMARSTIENCTARGTGDDCFAIWPTVFKKQVFPPGHNQVIHCTAQLPYLANGAAIYGGDSNVIRNCSFVDISQGSAILLSTTFPTENKDKSINNNFSGTTVIKDCVIKTSGGFDHEWGWRAAVEICLDKRGISGIEINNVTIENSLSNGLSVIAKNAEGKMGVLTNAVLQNVTVSNYGIGAKDKYTLFVSNDAHGDLVIKKSTISGIKNESADFSIVK